MHGGDRKILGTEVSLSYMADCRICRILLYFYKSLRNCVTFSCLIAIKWECGLEVNYLPIILPEHLGSVLGYFRVSLRPNSAKGLVRLGLCLYAN